jgi:hypothetical protein
VKCCSMCGRNLITGLTSTVSPRVNMSNTCKEGQKFVVSLLLLTFSTPHIVSWPSWLLYHRVRKSWRDLWITLYLGWELSWKILVLAMQYTSLTPFSLRHEQ